MKRPPVRWVIAYSLLVLAGCQNSGGGMDPFGRTTIPAPRTRTAADSAVFADPYYSGPASTAPSFAAPGTQPSGSFPAVVPYSQPATTIPTPNFNQGSDLRSSSAPRGQWVAPGTLSRRIEPESSSFSSTRSDSRIAPASAQASSPDRVANASYQEVIVIDGQTARPTTSHARFTTPRVARGQIDNRAAGSDNGRIDLSELPRVPARSASANPTGFRNVDTIRTVRTPPRSTSNSSNRASTAATAGRYGYEQDYTWLRGRLEYSAGKRQWKLRYIPIDGQTDRYGGSVILPASAELEDFKAGDFVEVRGRLGRSDAEASDFAANYSISEITVLR